MRRQHLHIFAESPVLSACSEAAVSEALAGAETDVNVAGERFSAAKQFHKEGIKELEKARLGDCILAVR